MKRCSDLVRVAQPNNEAVPFFAPTFSLLREVPGRAAGEPMKLAGERLRLGVVPTVVEEIARLFRKRRAGIGQPLPPRLGQDDKGHACIPVVGVPFDNADLLQRRDHARDRRRAEMHALGQFHPGQPVSGGRLQMKKQEKLVHGQPVDRRKLPGKPSPKGVGGL